MILVSQTHLHIRIGVKDIVAIAAAALLVSCASSAPRHPAPVVAPIPESTQVTRVYAIEQPSSVVGEELKGSVLPDTGGPQVLFGTSLNGTPVYLSDYLGQVVVASYWTSWCDPCWTELVQLEDIHTEYQGRDVQIIAINVGEGRSAIDSFLQQQRKPLRVTIVSDRFERASMIQGVNAVPTTLVFDAQGKVAHRYAGVFAFNAQRIRSDIDRLLSKQG